MRTTLVEFSPRCWRIERDGYVIGRYITDNYGRVRWHVVYAAAGMDASLDTLLDEGTRHDEGRAHYTQLMGRTAGPRAV